MEHLLGTDTDMVDSFKAFYGEAKGQCNEILKSSKEMNEEFGKLQNAKRVKVTKLASTQRKLKYSSETFSEYVRSINSLFEYFQDEDLITEMETELLKTKKPDDPPRDPPPPSTTTPTTTTPPNHMPMSRAFLNHMKRLLERVQHNYDNFYNACTKLEDKSRIGATGCQEYALKTDKKRTDRRINGRNLAFNQFGIAITAIITFITFMVLLGNGTVTFNGGVASAVVVAIGGAIMGIAIGIGAIVVTAFKEKKYKELKDTFFKIENKFEKLDAHVGSLKNLLLSQVHSQIYAVERVILDCEELLKEDTPYTRRMLRTTFAILVRKSDTYIEIIKPKDGGKGINLRELFFWKDTPIEPIPKRKSLCSCLFSNTADDDDSQSLAEQGRGGAAGGAGGGAVGGGVGGGAVGGGGAAVGGAAVGKGGANRNMIVPDPTNSVLQKGMHHQRQPSDSD